MGPGIFSNLQVAYSFEEEYLDPTYIDGLRRHHLSQLIVEMSSQDMENGHIRALPKQVRPVDATGFAFLSIVRSELSTFLLLYFLLRPSVGKFSLALGMHTHLRSLLLCHTAAFSTCADFMVVVSCGYLLLW